MPRTKPWMKLVFPAAGLLLGMHIPLLAQQPQSLDEKTAEQVYKNIQVLKGTPADLNWVNRCTLSKVHWAWTAKSAMSSERFDKDDKPLKFVGSPNDAGWW